MRPGTRSRSSEVDEVKLKSIMPSSFLESFIQNFNIFMQLAKYGQNDFQ